MKPLHWSLSMALGGHVSRFWEICKQTYIIAPKRSSPSDRGHWIYRPLHFDVWRKVKYSQKRENYSCPHCCTLTTCPKKPYTKWDQQSHTSSRYITTTSDQNLNTHTHTHTHLEHHHFDALVHESWSETERIHESFTLTSESPAVIIDNNISC